jgi:hypothetical protein
MKFEDALQQYLEPEEMKPEEQIRSTIYNTKSYSLKEFKFSTLSPFLTFLLKRTEYATTVNTPIRIEVPVDMPLSLDMRPYIDSVEAISEAQSKYTLHSIVWHGGASPQGGHYKTWAKNEGHWYEFEDTNVKPVSLKIKRYESTPDQEYLEDFHVDSHRWTIYMVVYKRAVPFVYNAAAVQVASLPTIDEKDLPELPRVLPAKAQPTLPILEKEKEGEAPIPEKDTSLSAEPVSVHVPTRTKPTPESDTVSTMIATELAALGLKDSDLKLDLNLDILRPSQQPIVPEPETANYELVEIMLNLPKPDNKLLLTNTEWKEASDTDPKEYYMTTKSGEDVRFFMTCPELEDSSISDGNRQPIDNIVYVHSEESGENVEFAKILKKTKKKTKQTQEDKIKELENKLFESIYKLKKTK